MVYSNSVFSFKSIFQNIISFRNRIKNTFIYSLMMNILLLIFYYSVYYCYFQTNDDFTLKAIASGLYGKPDYHLIYINVILGYLISSLYRIIPGIAWYDIIQYLVVLISLTFISYVFLNKKKQTVIASVAIFVLGYSLYVRPQYTKTVGICTIAGMLLLQHYFTSKRKSIAYLSIFMLVLGSLLRINQFLPCAAICFPILIPGLLNIFNRKDNDKRNRGIRLLLYGIFTLFLVFSFYLLDKQAYKDEVWTNYTNYNAERSQFDYGFPSYEENHELYNRLDINEDAYKLYNTYNFDDPDKFGIETMKQINKVRFNSFDLDRLIRSIVFLIDRFFTTSSMYIYTYLLIFTVVVLILRNRNRIDLVSALLSFLIFLFAVISSSYLKNNVFLDRVYHGFIFGLIFSLIIFITDENSNDKIRYIDYLCIILIVLSISAHSDNFRVNNEYTCLEGYNAQLEVVRTIHNDQDHIYIEDLASSIVPLKAMFNVFDDKLLNNRIFLGGWITNAAFNREIKERYNIHNPYKDCINNDKAIIISNRIDMIVKYINDYYDSNAQAVLIKQDSLAKYYKIVSK